MNRARRTVGGLLLAAGLVGALATPAAATWSIVLADCDTREVAVGTVTCLNNFDLLAIVPVVVVGKGGAAVQSAGDFDGQRRPVIFSGLMNGDSPQDIFARLQQISGHQSRQYGLADTQCRMLTFSGSNNSQWAGGVIGQQGTMVYAIQGNILAGGCVVPAIEAAVLNTTGDVAAKLMAGMEAARDMGGDGRCSCSPGNPTGCGCPPVGFQKSGHIGGMVVSRIGDTDDPVCNASGCVDGNYFMRLNVAFQSSGQPDPVIQLRALYDQWRAGLAGRPDAVQSVVTFEPGRLPPNGSAMGTMHIELNDWQGQPVSVETSIVRVVHSPLSAGISTIGDITDHGDGTFSVELTAGTSPGVDRFIIEVDDGIRRVTLTPEPRFEYFELGDINGDRVVDLDDHELFAGCVGGPEAQSPPEGCAPADFVNSDLDGDRDADVKDFTVFGVHID
jgi:hypothetical protein